MQLVVEGRNKIRKKCEKNDQYLHTCPTELNLKVCRTSPEIVSVCFPYFGLMSGVEQSWLPRWTTMDLPIISQTFILSLVSRKSALPLDATSISPKSPKGWVTNNTIITKTQGTFRAKTDFLQAYFFNWINIHIWIHGRLKLKWE